MVITRAARRYLLDRRTIADCGLKEFAAANDVTVDVAGKWLKDEGVTWRELYRTEMEARIRWMLHEGYTPAKMTEELGYEKIGSIYRWYKDIYGRPYRFKEVRDV